VKFVEFVAALDRYLVFSGHELTRIKFSAASEPFTPA